jgi:cytochrome c peroxidase
MRKYPVHAVLFSIVIVFALFSFTQSIKSDKEVFDTYKSNFEKLKIEASQFSSHVNSIKPTPDNKKSIVNEYNQLRDAFKAIEFIWEYTDPIYVKDYINGAPLPKLDKSAPGILIIQPRGLQVIDELLFEEHWNIENISEQATLLYQAINDYNFPAKINDRIVFEALRVELIRSFNLGLTGFDVPASERSIVDAIVIFTQLNKTIECYKSRIENVDPNLYKNIAFKFNLGLKMLNSNIAFDKFDRLSFLKVVVNPLFADLLKAQHLLGIETIYESTTGTKFALNLEATNLFSNKILNADYYVNVPQNISLPKLENLGKLLFFDPILSASNERSCASCHNPKKGFTDGESKSLAFGMKGRIDRNSPTLINSVYSERYFHDLRADALEDQMEHVVVSEKEFNTNIIEVISKLNQSSEYLSLFKELYQNETSPINKHTIAFAITSYVKSLSSYNSFFDKYVRGESNDLSASAKRGFNLFMGKAACGTCHFAPNFNGTVPPLYNESESEVLGVPENPYTKILVIDNDEGRIGAKLKEGAPFYRYSFKTPSIRNVALTAPYMHNGAYKSLQDVMDFYNKGGGLGIGINVPYQTLPADPLNLNKQEMKDIISFMESLTDTSGLTSVPVSLPKFENRNDWNYRKIGGIY